ncbi:MAG: NAD(P)H-dependent oxidoreductase, partial [Ilumatobacteraceae bacterium]
MTVNVLLVCGSLQAKSANRAALDVAERRLDRLEDVCVDRADELDVLPVFNVDKQDRPGPAVESFRTRLAFADVVLIACPEYA